MKKILFVANVTKEHVLKFHIPTIKKFKNEGWRVDVASHGDDTIPFCDNQFNACWKRSPFTFDTLKGIKWLKTVIEKEKYDVVYCHTPVGGLVGRLASIKARKNGTKVVYCAHGLHFYKGAPLLNWLIYFPIEKFLAKYTDLFITINDEDFNLVSEKFNKNLQVEIIDGIGVDFSRLTIDETSAFRAQYRNDLNIPEDAIVLIYIAELIKNKNQQLLINSLKQILFTHKNFYLLLVGPDHTDGAYKNMATDIGVADNVRFLGWRSDIAQLLAASDICTASSLREGFGINLVEAMYCNVPVIATNNRGHKTVIKNNVNGLLLETNTPDEMGQKVLTLFNNPDLRMSLSHCDTSKYDCDFIAEKVYKIIT